MSHTSVLLLSLGQERGAGGFWEGIQMLGKLVGSAFQPSPPFLVRCTHDDERIVVRGHKLVLRANAKRFS
jgi:hypothetical protein